LPAGLRPAKRQKTLTFSRPPVTVLPESEVVATSLDSIALLICETVAPGCVEA